MPDTSVDIYEKLTLAQNQIPAIRAGAAPGFDHTAAIAAATTAKQAFESIIADLMVDSFEVSGSGKLQILPYTNPFSITQGQPFTYQLRSAGGTAPFRWVWSGTLPAGLTLDANGLITGTVLAAPGAQFIVNVTVLDSANPVAFDASTLWFKVTP